MTAKDFGDLVRKLRREQHLSQRDLAMACGTGIRFIVDLESGKATCQLGKSLSVLQALGTHLELANGVIQP